MACTSNTVSTEVAGSRARITEPILSLLAGIRATCSAPTSRAAGAATFRGPPSSITGRTPTYTDPILIEATLTTVTILATTIGLRTTGGPTILGQQIGRAHA